MPKIARFSNISICIYPNDHNPPHFHAIYDGKEALIQISPIVILKGNLPPAIERVVIKWARVHRIQLLEIWKYATEHKRLPKISSLQ